MKSPHVVLLFVLMTLVASASSAQTADATIAEHSGKFSPKAAACLRACLGGGKPADRYVCVGLDAAAKSRVEQLAAKIKVMDGRIAAHAARLVDCESRIKALESQVGVLGNKDKDLQRQIDDLKGQAKDLGKAIDSLNERYMFLVRDFGDLARKHGAEIEKLKTRVGELKTRVSTIESKMSHVRLSARVGVLVLPAFDGSSPYSGFSFGPRLTLNLTERTWLAVDTDLLLSPGSSNPIGMNVRGGVGYDFHPNWYVTAGFGSVWVNCDSRLKAQAAYLTPDIGFGGRSGWFDASIRLFAGPKFEHGNITGTVGGGLFLGATL